MQRVKRIMWLTSNGFDAQLALNVTAVSEPSVRTTAPAPARLEDALTQPGKEDAGDGSASRGRSGGLPHGCRPKSASRMR